MKHVSAFMSLSPRTTGMRTPVGSALQIMRDNGFHHLPIMDQSGLLMGVVNDYEVLKKVREGDPMAWVSQCIREGAARAEATDPVNEVLERQLDEGRNSTLVVNAIGQPIGVFTERDAMKLADEQLSTDKLVGDVMSEGQVYTADPNMAADRALELMVSNGVRHLPVVENGQVIGVISHRDCVGVEQAPVSTLLRTTLRYGRGDTRLVDAVAAMQAEQFGCLPVLGPEGEVVGLLTRTDVLRALVEQLEDDEDTADEPAPDDEDED